MSPPTNAEARNSLALNNLCNLITSAHLASVPLCGAVWRSISNLLNAAMETEIKDLSTDQLLQVILQACVNHPLVEMAPREPEHGPNMLQWLKEAWENQGWDIPSTLQTGHGKTGEVRLGRELVYKTYVDYGSEVTLLESRNGIVRGTTGLTTWIGAAVLADFIVDTPEITKGRRVLELGSGMGLAAASLLKQKDNLPKSYLATDCHHHVLALLEHNLNINLNQVSVESLESFRDEMCQQLCEEEVKPGIIVPWTPTMEEISPDSELSVRAMQVDWRSPPRLPPVDVVIGSDIVYCHDLIPPLVTLLKSFLNGEAFDEKEKSKTQLSNINKDDNPRGREVFIACTRRSRETIEVFTMELSKQELEYEMYYQAFLNKESAIFEHNETYHPIKIYRISLPKSC